MMDYAILHVFVGMPTRMPVEYSDLSGVVWCFGE